MWWLSYVTCVDVVFAIITFDIYVEVQEPDHFHTLDIMWVGRCVDLEI